MASASGDAAGEAVKQRMPRGSSGLPKGGSKSGSKYQARVNYKPEGKTRKELRGLGSFDSVEQAEQAVAAAHAAAEMRGGNYLLAIGVYGIL